MVRLVLRGAGIAVVTALFACGGSDETTSPAPEAAAAGGSRPSGNGACGLMLQGEVDELFGASIGAGAHETLEGGIELCSWPASGDPALLLQVSPSTGDIRTAVDLGGGYRVVEITEMSGPAAAAVEEADGPGMVVVIALTAGEKTVTVSPIGLPIADGSPELDRLEALIDRIASRL